MTKKRMKSEEEVKAEKLKRDYDNLACDLNFCPEPSYTFNVGDKVHIGNLKNVTIAEVLNDGKIYLVTYEYVDENYGNPVTHTGMQRYFFWYSIRPISNNTESFIRNTDIDIRYMQMSIEGLLNKKYSFGINMNPDYQRDYVWTLEDKQNLIDSIFGHIDIGKFAFINTGNMECEYEILDGKQRLSAIFEFYENRFTYKGKYFNDLSVRDQDYFENFCVSVGESSRMDKKTILKYFLVLNCRGKEMDNAQIEKVRDMYLKTNK